jgi:hypothetical protein
MDKVLSSRVLIIATIAYGITIGILGVLGTRSVGIVATIGAMILGGLWAVRGLLVKRSS